MTAINEFLDVANAFNSELKVAWVAWLAWGIGQAFWYKWERSSAGRPRVSSAARAPRKPAPKRHKVAPVVGRLITPAHIEATPRVQPEVPLASPAPPAVAFDPTKAIVETFDPRSRGDLDAIVADMEANMPRGGDASHVH
jgi:hypothetical protein